ncbi:glycosyltransferase family 2 protein [Leptobacterium sp. I13]|uniref:glycosyltransferase family 2 protein n=1 Tax=Leptobacterium meishanense TaxID=3128904 RepID=UPI0030ED4185
MPLFSVVIPLFNKERIIKNTVDSVLNQTFDDYEVVIVNDGSTDNSLEIVKEIDHPKVTIYDLQKNYGASYARNYGVGKASGELIAFLDADDNWFSNHLLELNLLFQKFPEAGFWGTRYQLVHFDTFIELANLSIDLHNKPDHFLIKDFFYASLKFCPACSSSTAMRKKTFLSLNGFDVNMRSGQDTDLWVRVGLKHKMALSKTVTANYLQSPNSLSSSHFVADRVQMVDKYKNDELNNPGLKKFMDLNRFSIGLERKIKGDLKAYQNIYDSIDRNNLTFKQKILLNTPRIFLKHMIRLRAFLAKRRIRLKVIG